MTIFTPRELEIIKYMIDGLRDFAIAEKLGIEPRVVSTHKFNARQKLGMEAHDNDFHFLMEVFTYLNSLEPEVQIILLTKYGIDNFHYIRRRRGN